MLINGILTEERLAMADRVAQATGAPSHYRHICLADASWRRKAEALRLPYFVSKPHKCWRVPNI